MPTKANNLSPEEYRRKWGIPDWRDIKSYPVSLLDTLWRWEFLRRREDYRRDWEHYFPKTVLLHKEFEGRPRFNSLCIWLSFLDADPWSPNFRAFMPDSEKKYGLEGLPNPAIPEPENLRFVRPAEPGHLRIGAIAYGNGRRAAIIPRNHAALCIDLAQPIKPQLDGYERLFRKLAEGNEITMRGNKRQRRDHYAQYLRALDAKATGATNKEIWEVIVGDYANNPYARGRDLVRAAENLRDKHPA